MSATTVAVLVLGWVAGWVLGARPRRLPRVRSAPVGAVSVVIPARNEATRLPRLLACLDAARAGHELEVVVVDDSSTDATAAQAASWGATVLRVSPPAGWTGKAWACWRGAQEARGDVLVFLDADTEPTPELFPALVARVRAHAALVSVQPWHRTESAYEQLSAVCNEIAVMGAGTGPARGPRWWRRPMAFGPVIGIGRADYFRIGGHAGVRASVVEDLALAARAARAGLTVESWCGGDAVVFRMYPEGVRQLVEGWSKNFATGAATTPPARVVAVVAWVAATLTAGALGVGAAVTLATGGGAPAGVSAGVLVYAAFGVQGWALLRRVGSFGWTGAMALPLLALAFVALFLRSALLAGLRRPRRWRGRVVASGASR
jgi:hypothetical protein